MRRLPPGYDPVVRMVGLGQRRGATVGVAPRWPIGPGPALARPGRMKIRATTPYNVRPVGAGQRHRVTVGVVLPWPVGTVPALARSGRTKIRATTPCNSLPPDHDPVVRPVGAGQRREATVGAALPWRIGTGPALARPGRTEIRATTPCNVRTVGAGQRRGATVGVVLPWRIGTGPATARLGRTKMRATTPCNSLPPDHDPVVRTLGVGQRRGARIGTALPWPIGAGPAVARPGRATIRATTPCNSLPPDHDPVVRTLGAGPRRGATVGAALPWPIGAGPAMARPGRATIRATTPAFAGAGSHATACHRTTIRW